MNTATNRPSTTVGAGELMPEDAQCPKCGYSLRGLRSGGRCPECGALFSGGKRRKYFNDTMTDAPVRYLRVLAAGCWMLAVGGLLSSICLWAGTPDRTIVLGAGGAAACLWWAGVFVVTAPRQTVARSRAELKAEWRRWRPLALATQAGWIACAAALAGAAVLHEMAINTAATTGAALVASPNEQALRVLGWAAYLVAIAGLVPLCLILADLADWAGNTTLGDRFRDSAWALCVGVPLMLVSVAVIRVMAGRLSGPVGFTLYIVMIFSGLGVTIGSLVFLASLIRLAGMSLWAISNSLTGMERDERIAERQRRHEEELAARSYPAPADPGGPGKGRASAPARPGPLSKNEGYVVPRSGDLKPYDLAPEEPGDRP